MDGNAVQPSHILNVIYYITVLVKITGNIEAIFSTELEIHTSLILICICHDTAEPVQAGGSFHHVIFFRGVRNLCPLIFPIGILILAALLKPLIPDLMPQAVFRIDGQGDRVAAENIDFLP